MRPSLLSLLTVSSSLIIASFGAHGADPRGNAPFVGVVPPVVAQPGQYQIQSQDMSRAIQEVITRIGKVQDSDRDYLENVVKELTKATNDYNTMLVSGAFKQLSDKSYCSSSSAPECANYIKGIPLQEFLAVLNEVRATKLKIETKLQLLTSVAGALPSEQIISEGKTSNKLPALRNIDFSKVVGPVLERIKVVEGYANNYGFLIYGAEGIQTIAPNSGTALNPALNFSLMTGERIKALQKEVRILSTPSDEFERAAESHGNQTKALIARFIFNYGKSEKYRPRDENDEKARLEAFNNVANAFWMRSYLRKVYAVRVGAIIPANYKKRYLNIDKYLVLIDLLSTFKEEVGPSQIDDSTLADAAENIRNIMETVDARASKILSGDASFLARLNSFITLLKGERPTAEALNMIMALVAADIKEERDLSLGGGLESLLANYDQRWNASSADRAITDKRVCAYDHLASLESGNQNCYQGNPEAGLKGTFLTLNDEANAQSEKIKNAMRIRNEIRLAQLANSLKSSDGKPTGAAGRRGN